MHDSSSKAMKVLAVLQAIVILNSLALGQSRTTYGFKMVKPRVSDALSFEDRFIRIQFGIITRIIFKLTNKTINPIEILWDRVSFVDTNSEAHRVMHEGVRYIERDKALPPTVIPPRASINDSIIPTDHISYDSKEIEWKVRDLFESGRSRYKGKTFSVFLPLKVNGRIINYTFSFIVEEQKPRAPVSGRPATGTNFELNRLFKEKVSRAESKDDWPFKVEEGELACGPGSRAVFFIAQGKVYALNGWALDTKVDGNPVASLSEIVAPGKDTGPFIRKALALCQ